MTFIKHIYFIYLFFLPFMMITNVVCEHNKHSFNIIKSYLFKNSTNYTQLINKFQYNLIKSRNFECLFTKYPTVHDFLFDFNEFKSNKYLNSTQLTHYWHQYMNDSNQISNEFIDIIDNTCLKIDDFMNITFGNSKIDENLEYLDDILQIIMLQSVNNGCDLCLNITESAKVDSFHVWLYGFIFVTIINTSSLVGAIVIPCSNKDYYKKILMLLIALAIGSLAGSGFLHLIPQAHGITEDPHYTTNHIYVWKGLVIMCGVYLFYLVERIMKILISIRKSRIKSKKIVKKIPSTTYDSLENFGFIKTNDQPVDVSVELRTKIVNEPYRNDNKRKHHGHSHGLNENANDVTLVSPVAWMIIFGDGLHNFIDGLSIGAAFTESIFKGISICVAVICEEFPHELGDFAILINAGMSFRQALLFNALSACCCYGGLILGVIVGENLNANQWIYAVAGGMFLYIALCDMVPELTETGDEIEEAHMKMMIENSKKRNNNTNNNNNLDSNNNTTMNIDDHDELELYHSIDVKLKIKLLVIQNVGILLGFMVMFIMARYSKNIEF